MSATLPRPSAPPSPFLPSEIKYSASLVRGQAVTHLVLGSLLFVTAVLGTRHGAPWWCGAGLVCAMAAIMCGVCGLLAHWLWYRNWAIKAFMVSSGAVLALCLVTVALTLYYSMAAASHHDHHQYQQQQQDPLHRNATEQQVNDMFFELPPLPPSRSLVSNLVMGLLAELCLALWSLAVSWRGVRAEEFTTARREQLVGQAIASSAARTSSNTRETDAPGGGSGGGGTMPLAALYHLLQAHPELLHSKVQWGPDCPPRPPSHASMDYHERVSRYLSNTQEADALTDRNPSPTSITSLTTRKKRSSSVPDNGRQNHSKNKSGHRRKSRSKSELRGKKEEERKKKCNKSQKQQEQEAAGGDSPGYSSSSPPSSPVDLSSSPITSSSPDSPSDTSPSSTLTRLESAESIDDLDSVDQLKRPKQQQHQQQGSKQQSQERSKLQQPQLQCKLQQLHSKQHSKKQQQQQKQPQTDSKQLQQSDEQCKLQEPPCERELPVLRQCQSLVLGLQTLSPLSSHVIRPAAMMPGKKLADTEKKKHDQRNSKQGREQQRQREQQQHEQETYEEVNPMTSSSPAQDSSDGEYNVTFVHEPLQPPPLPKKEFAQPKLVINEKLHKESKIHTNKEPLPPKMKNRQNSPTNGEEHKLKIERDSCEDNSSDDKFQVDPVTATVQGAFVVMVNNTKTINRKKKDKKPPPIPVKCHRPAEICKLPQATAETSESPPTKENEYSNTTHQGDELAEKNLENSTTSLATSESNVPHDTLEIGAPSPSPQNTKGLEPPGNFQEDTSGEPRYEPIATPTNGSQSDSKERKEAKTDVPSTLQDQPSSRIYGNLPPPLKDEPACQVYSNLPPPVKDDPRSRVYSNVPPPPPPPPSAAQDEQPQAQDPCSSSSARADHCKIVIDNEKQIKERSNKKLAKRPLSIEIRPYQNKDIIINRIKTIAQLKKTSQS